jgi:hypothetical protein
MDKEIAISDLVKMDFDEAFNKDNCYGFYDWFCKDSSLPNKARTLFAKMKSLVRSGKFDPAKCYVFFNNYPCCGKLYDDFRICDLETGDILYTVSPSNRVGKADVWGVDNDFEAPLVSGTWREVRMWFFN